MFFSLFITGTIIEFSHVGAGFIDGIIISRYLGPSAMAAEGIVYPIYSILGIISGLLAVSMQMRCSQAIGRGNRKDFSMFASITIYIGTALSLLMTALILPLVRPLTVTLGASGNAAELAEPGSRYLLGVAFGIPALIMSAILGPVLQLDNGNSIIQTGALIEAVSNIVFDLLSVKLNLGIFGIGLSTAIASYFNLLYQCTFFLRKKRIFRFVKPDVPIKEVFMMLSNGLEKVMIRAANTIRPIILNGIIISYGGSLAMSVLSMRNNFSDFVVVFGVGIASAVSLLTSVYFGEINEEGIEEIIVYKQKLIRLFAGSECVIMLVFARFIAHFYIPEDGKTLDMATFAIRMLAIQLPLQAMISSRIKYLQAIHKKVNMNLLIVATKLIFVLLSALVLGKLFGVYGILACFTASDIVTLVSIFVYYSISCKKVPPTKRALLNLPDYFHYDPGNEISLDIRDIDDVVLASEQIVLFCNGHNADATTSYFAALAFEELTSNIILHGFPKNRSANPMIDLRAVITDNSFVIRLRDNCPQYDVTEAIAAINEEGSDPIHNIGIRIVSKTASNIEYFRTFNTNSLIITFELGN